MMLPLTHAPVVAVVVMIVVAVVDQVAGVNVVEADGVIATLAPVNVDALSVNHLKSPLI